MHRFFEEKSRFKVLLVAKTYVCFSVQTVQTNSYFAMLKLINLHTNSRDETPGCQKDSFQTKVTNLVTFWRTLEWKMQLCVYSGH
jgi:hypothetical protein